MQKPSEGFFQYLENRGFNVQSCIEKMASNEELSNLVFGLTHLNDKQFNPAKTILLQTILKAKPTKVFHDCFLLYIQILHENNLLSFENVIKTSFFSKHLKYIFMNLNCSQLFDINTFNFFVKYQNYFDNAEIAACFNNIPLRGIRAEHLAVIKTICESHAEKGTLPTQDIIHYIQRTVLGFQPEQEQLRFNPSTYNTRQSTHTATVHESVSESLKRLDLRYKDLYDKKIKQNLSEINLFMQSLPANAKHSAAQRYWKMLTEQKAYLNYEDPKSKVSIKKLLHLFWVAIQDFSVRYYDATDKEHNIIDLAKLLIVDAFYEAQRDGNINSAGIDDQSAQDKFPICAPGFINKLTEKLIGIHPDVQITIINHQIAGEKFKALIFEKVINILRLKIQEKKQVNEKLENQYINNAVKNIWPSIKDEISEIFFQEFKILFNNNKANPNYVTYMELAEEIELPPRQIENLHKLNQEPSRKRLASDEDLENELSSPKLTSKFSLFTNCDSGDIKASDIVMAKSMHP